MKVCEVFLDDGEYTLLKKMLIHDRKMLLMKKHPISGYELFCDLLHEIYSPVADGWSTLETMLKESTDELKLLRLMTKYIFSEDEDYFVRQIGKRMAEFQCPNDFAFIIYKVNQGEAK